MKKNPQYTLSTTTDIKIFLLFILDRIGYPIDYSALSGIIAENAPTLSMEYEECLRALSDSGHLYTDEVDAERYYMISPTGKQVAAELYETLDPALREKSERCAAKYLSLSKRDAKVRTWMTPLAGGRFEVGMEITDPEGRLLSATLTLPSKADAEAVRHRFQTRPEGIYRSVLFGATGQFEYLS